jgi:hypothetical protein
MPYDKPVDVFMKPCGPRVINVVQKPLKGNHALRTCPETYEGNHGRNMRGGRKSLVCSDVPK